MEIRKRRVWRSMPLAAGLAVVTAAGGMALGAVAVSHRHPQSAPPRPVLSTTTVVRTDLTTTATYNATVGFAALRTVTGTGSGTITRLPQAGSVVRRGQPLYWVDDQPVVAFYGTTPLFRTLGPPDPSTAQVSLQSAQAGLLGAQQGLTTAENEKKPPASAAALAQDQAAVAQAQNTVDTDQTALDQASAPPAGQDVTIVAANLAALGYLPASAADMSTWSYALTQAVKDFQQSAGMAATGTLAPSQVAVVPGPARVGAVLASVGDPASSPVLSLTRTTKLITFTANGDLHTGETLTVSTVGGAPLNGRIVALAPAGSGFQVQARADDPGALSAAGSVSVTVITASHRGVLAVPVEALVALADGGYALQTPGGLLLPVSIGPIVNDQVEVSGLGVRVGLQVVTAA
jgi:peptidoglycan hydrolase-like protein with peptidoglycan-binding domain